jgi:hypothetical protein
MTDWLAVKPQTERDVEQLTFITKANNGVYIDCYRIVRVRRVWACETTNLLDTEWRRITSSDSYREARDWLYKTVCGELNIKSNKVVDFWRDVAW